MAAPAGTLTYYTVVTLNAAGNSNGDATLIAAAFNGVIFPGVSPVAAIATATAAAVVIEWAQSSIKVGNQLAADAVAREVAALSASLNATVTGITASTQIVLT